MTALCIKYWFCRLGNNIYSLINALHISLFYNYSKIIIPPHPFLNTTCITITDAADEEHEYVEDKYSFYYRYKLVKKYGKAPFLTNSDKIINILRGLFNISPDAPLGDNDCVIHIRSGDLFTSPNPHPLYIPPPLSYYTYILNNTQYDTIYLVSEDAHNPVVNKLLEIYPHIIYKQQSLEEDITLIMRAKNVVASAGTFVPALCKLSVYCERFINLSAINDYTIYSSSQYPWAHNAGQIDLMLSYTSELSLSDMYQTNIVITEPNLDIETGRRPTLVWLSDDVASMVSYWGLHMLQYKFKAHPLLFISKMGCDYYIWIETVIEYTSASGTTETYVERGEYDRRYTYGEEYSHLDPDFDVIPKRDRIQEEIEEYGERHMYSKSNGIWSCQPSGRKRVEAICEERKIPMTSVTCVFKRKDGHWR